MGRRLAAVVANALVALVIMFGMTATAHAVTWTAGELVQSIEDAKAAGQPFDRLLAVKVEEELSKKGFQIVDGTLVFKKTVPAKYRNLAQATPGTGVNSPEDYEGMLRTKFLDMPSAALHLGTCDAPFPEGVLRAAQTSAVDFSAAFDNSATYIGFTTTPNTVVLTADVAAQITAYTSFGMEWCGQVIWPFQCSQWVKNPACPPCPSKGPCPSCPFPDVCLIPGAPTVVEEAWTDWAPATITGPLTGKASLTLTHALTVSNNTISVGASAKLDGSATFSPSVTMGAVKRDDRLISVPPGIYAPHVDKAPIFATFNTQVEQTLIWAKTIPFVGDQSAQEVLTPDMLAQQQARIDATMAQYFPIQVTLPTIADFSNLDPASQALVMWVLDFLRNNVGIVGEFAFNVVKEHWSEVLYYALTNNQDALKQLFAYQALCPGLELLKTGMAVQPLYDISTGVCAAVDPRTAGTGPFYSDAACANEVAFQKEDFARFCQETMTPSPNPLLGNAAAWPSLKLETDPNPGAAGPATKWSLSSGAQLSAGVEPIKQNHVPYMKRVNYRQVGGCALEMRVYKKDVGATNLTPLLWIHGGAWRYRGAGYVGLESLISSYTEEGFVVFTPFYRLAGNDDANAECRNVSWDGMVADAEAALDWVQANGAQFGAADTTRVAVTGQSAGAHLAAWLMTHRSADVSRGMLVYPPIDFSDYLTRLQGVGGASFPPLSDAANTPYNPTAGTSYLEGYLQLPAGGAHSVNLNAPPVSITENSFAAMVRTDPASFPPAFILHGTRDALLSHSQSELLCNAYGGSVSLDWNVTPDVRAIFPCGTGSEAHFFKEADHAFEICLNTSIPRLCRAGSAAGAAALADSLRQGRMWLADRQIAPLAVAAVKPSSGVTYSAALISDGSLGTRLQMTAKGQWVRLDLGTAQPVAALGINWVQLHTRFDVQLSTDGVTWQTAWSGTSGGNSLELETVDLGGRVARFVKIVGNGTTQSGVSNLAEVRVYGKAPIVGLKPVAVTASGNDGNRPANVLDGSLSTRWSVIGDGQWLQADLGAPKFLGTVGLAWYRGDQRVARFDLMTSLDGVNWSPALTGAVSLGNTLREELYDFEPVAARYVRVIGHGSNTGLQTGITELDVYGVK
jgi:acetyl esterase/lipase